MPFYKDSLSHGNLYFEFIVVFPPHQSLTPDHEKALRQVFAYTSTNAELEKNPKAVPL